MSVMPNLLSDGWKHFFKRFMRFTLARRQNPNKQLMNFSFFACKKRSGFSPSTTVELSRTRVIKTKGSLAHFVYGSQIRIGVSQDNRMTLIKRPGKPPIY